MKMTALDSNETTRAAGFSPRGVPLPARDKDSLRPRRLTLDASRKGERPAAREDNPSALRLTEGTQV